MLHQNRCSEATLVFLVYFFQELRPVWRLPELCGACPALARRLNSRQRLDYLLNCLQVGSLKIHAAGVGVLNTIGHDLNLVAVCIARRRGPPRIQHLAGLWAWPPGRPFVLERREYRPSIAW